MEEATKTQNTMIALALCGIRTDEATAEMIWRIREALTQNQENLTIAQISKIQAQVRRNNDKPKSNIMVPVQK